MSTTEKRADAGAIAAAASENPVPTATRAAGTAGTGAAHAAPTRAVGAGRAPGILRAGLSALVIELRGYVRTPDTIVFTFLFPILMLGIFSVAFESMGKVGALPDGTGGVTMAEYYLPGMVAAGIFLSGVQNLAIDIAREKSDGWLRRLGATAISPVSYFIGKAGMILITSLAQAALLIAVAKFAFDVRLPEEPELWLRFAWLFALGIVTMTMLGIALSSLPRSSRSATAVVLPVVLLLQFISGVYLQFTMLPEWLQNFASLFPLKWLAQGMRSVFLPEHFAKAELSGSWDLGLVAVNLGIWLVVGLVISLITFRWTRRS
ncbi:ABC transporter permease [Leucobacter sp. CSA2]|uniref:ABC transporter permease n=1 Tax=Leucobacter edaphi TaxID=2796472 RepID=A0A934QCX2_9MICO|nr:ABC transporter permease [Leucobacter edaphi]MBK0422153.1 ABC transporter permease [Leucobacter edaphi]